MGEIVGNREFDEPEVGATFLNVTFNQWLIVFVRK
jgi:hypothetical protein